MKQGGTLVEELVFGTVMWLLIQSELPHTPEYPPLSALYNKGDGGNYESQNLKTERQSHFSL